MTLQLTLDMSQRWLFSKPKYGPPGETIRPADYEVAEIPDSKGGAQMRFWFLLAAMMGPRFFVGLSSCLPSEWP